MLRCEISIVPFGIEERRRHITSLEIARTSAHDNPEDYRVSVFAADGEFVNSYVVRQHYYDDGAANLVRRALEILTLEGAY